MEHPPVDDLDGQQLALSYFDSPVFESTMQHLLASGVSKLTIETYNSFKVNDIPSVFEEWIEHCSKNGGKIRMLNAANQPKMRGAASEIAMLAFQYFYDKHKQKQKEKWFVPANNYDINIIFVDEGGEVKSIEFVKR